MTVREIDIHTLPSMLTALRLPSFHKLWAEIATRADTEGWPAARPSGPSAPFIRSTGSNDRVPRPGSKPRRSGRI